MTIKLVETNAEIAKKINEAIAKEVNAKVGPKMTQLRSRLIPVFRSALLTSPEINSLQSGLLRLEFGLDSDPTSDIIEAVLASLQVTWTRVSPKGLRGGITVVLQPSDFSNLLTLPQGNQPIEGGSLPWLTWLLTLGDSVIITGYGVEFGNFPDTRTGEAKMSQKFAPYKVNSSFSGTIDDNFITRAISRAFPQVQRIIQGVL